ncbi:hypothetical protein LCGC14_2312720 [marine sediment metagenome]|uniref:Uncharacterized protein n=1 Tax=marine sediment metagenome TaxID=412755 RepID=A0A0F9EXJ0_9ZZZZ
MPGAGLSAGALVGLVRKLYLDWPDHRPIKAGNATPAVAEWPVSVGIVFLIFNLDDTSRTIWQRPDFSFAYKDPISVNIHFTDVFQFAESPNFLGGAVEGRVNSF